MLLDKQSISMHESLFSGQTFSWDIPCRHHMIYTAIIDGTPILIKNNANNDANIYAYIPANRSASSAKRMAKYFSLDIDGKTIFSGNFINSYPDIYRLVSSQEYQALRVLRQDPFEALVTFICAQGIGMTLIRRQVERIREYYGKRIVTVFDGTPIILHSFPSPAELANANPMELRLCTNNNLVRARNLKAAAAKIAVGSIDLSSLSNPDLPLEEVRNTLMSCDGIGLKIADCIALYGLGRFDAFPIDTHVWQYLREWFHLGSSLRSLSRRHYCYLQDEARAILGHDRAGIAGHILFHCWRREVKKMSSF